MALAGSKILPARSHAVHGFVHIVPGWDTQWCIIALIIHICCFYVKECKQQLCIVRAFFIT